MPAIRWDNVNGPSLAQASQPLAAASQTFNNAFGDLRDTLKERQAIEDGNWQNAKVNNTTALLDAVAKYQDPEKLKAAQADPNSDLNQMRAQFGNQIDADKVRGAADARIAQTMDQAAKKIAYDHAQRDERTAKPLDAMHRAALDGKEDDFNKAMAEYTAAGGVDAASALKYKLDRSRTVVEQGQQDKKFGMDLKLGQSTMDHQRAEEATARAMAAVAASNAATQATSVKQQGQFQNWQMNTADQAATAARQAAKVGAYRKELADSGNLYAKEGVWDGSQASDFIETLTKNKIGDDPGERSAIVARIGQIAKKGIAIQAADGSEYVVHKLPVAALRAAMIGATDQMVNGWNQGYANEMQKNLKAILQTAGQQTDASGKAIPGNKMLDDLAAFTSMLHDSTENAPPMSPSLPSAKVPGRRK